MSNWCDNYIEISGTKENMKPLYDFFTEHSEKETLVMNTLIPHDDEYKKIEESKNFLLNPQVTFYGTKWDFGANEANVILASEDCITIAPQTAWSPPVEFCKRLRNRYGVEVAISFEEPGVGFIGKHVYYPDGDEDIIEYDDIMFGYYELNKDRFWEELEYNMEYYKNEEELSLESIKTKFEYLNEKELKELETIYNEEY